jgi:hypothetical protein
MTPNERMLEWLRQHDHRPRLEKEGLAPNYQHLLQACRALRVTTETQVRVLMGLLDHEYGAGFGHGWDEQARADDGA